MNLNQIKADCEDALTLWDRATLEINARQSGVLEALRVVASESPRWCLALIERIQSEDSEKEKRIEELEDRLRDVTELCERLVKAYTEEEDLKECIDELELWLE